VNGIIAIAFVVVKNHLQGVIYVPLKVPSIRSTRSGQTSPKPLVIGIEFDQNNISSALVDDQGQIVAEFLTETPQRSTRAAVTALAGAILNLSAAKERGASPITGIGITVQGLVDSSTNRVSVAGLRGWTRVPILNLLEENLDETGHDIRTPLSETHTRAHILTSGHPVMNVNSAMGAMVAAESWNGSARGKNNVIYLSIGAEIEAGILANGNLVTGAGGMAGAAGWLTVTDQFRAEYEQQGCLSAEAAMNAITRRAIEEWDGRGNTMLSGLIKADSSQLDALTIIRAAQGGDKLAVKVVSETCRWLGRGAASLIAMFNPEVIVFGGELGPALKKFLDEIRAETWRWVSLGAAKQCRFVTATITRNAGLIGAARLAELKVRQQ